MSCAGAAFVLLTGEEESTVSMTFCQSIVYQNRSPAVGRIAFPMTKPGAQLRELAAAGTHQVAGVANAYCALLAGGAGFPALYLSGGGLAACAGLPDLGLNSLAEVAAETARITDAVELPLLVDADTGFGNLLCVRRTARTLQRSGAAGIHIEDQAEARRCGQRPNKRLCSAAQMCDRIKAACDGRTDDAFVIMARTDSLAGEGIEAACERAAAYREAGADMLFLEGATASGQYAEAARLGLPVLANITEFGVTPLFALAELADKGVSLVLHPLTVLRVMMKAAEDAYRQLRAAGSARDLLAAMHTREQLYRYLDYHRCERLLDGQAPTEEK